jgi:hypothetical protein
VVEHVPNEHETLSLNPNTTAGRKEEERERAKRVRKKEKGKKKERKEGGKEGRKEGRKRKRERKKKEILDQKHPVCVCWLLPGHSI